MSYRLATVAGLMLLLIAVSSMAQEKQQAQIIRVEDLSATELHSVLFLSAADTCLVRHDQGMIYRINGWVYGNELFKSYLDPAQTCSDAYPFTVTAINMPMIFDDTTDLTVSMDVEAVDYTSYPGCPIPGETMTISADYDLAVPSGGGLFDIWIPLDTPIVVNGPFFAGFFISNVLDPASGAALITDSFPAPCVSFNIWDPDFGWVDLSNNDYLNFPGRLVLYAAGIPGGGEIPDPPPAAALVSPTDGGVLYGQAELWAADTSGSTIIDYVSFAYAGVSTGGALVEIGSDHDGASPLRDGVSAATSGSGFSMPWDLSGMLEGTYTLRATVYDTVGRSSFTEVEVTIEPTPPLPTITAPDEGAVFCSPLELDVYCADENIDYIQIDRKPAGQYYSIGLTALDQNSLGDANGNPDDGNTQITGEFGDFYSGPVAAAVAAMSWYDRGYTGVISDGDSTLTLPELAENLAARFGTRANHGTYDEDIYLGLRSYFADRADRLEFDYMRNPDYFTLRKWVEQEERVVILGAGGDPGLWMALDGFTDWLMFDNTWHLRMSNPMSGTIIDVPIREATFGTEVSYGGTWHPVDIIVSILPVDWDVDMTVTGVDIMGADGWSVDWVPSGLTEGEHYYFRAVTEDATGYDGSSSIILKYACSQVYQPGDYTGDGNTDLSDLYRLIYFVATNGPAPEGGAGRADSNCDNLINVADIVYYMNYLYGFTTAPCH